MSINTIRKQNRIEIRIDDKNKSLLEKAALILGESLSTYVLRNSLNAAQNDISNHETLTLSEEDKNLFYSLVTSPPAPNQKLKNLLRS